MICMKLGVHMNNLAIELGEIKGQRQHSQTFVLYFQTTGLVAKHGVHVAGSGRKN